MVDVLTAYQHGIREDLGGLGLDLEIDLLTTRSPTGGDGHPVVRLTNHCLIEGNPTHLLLGLFSENLIVRCWFAGVVDSPVSRRLCGDRPEPVSDRDRSMGDRKLEYADPRLLDQVEEIARWFADPGPLPHRMVFKDVQYAKFKVLEFDEAIGRYRERDARPDEVSRE